MGLALDSSVLIVAEREARPVSSLLTALQQQHGENEIVVSAITVVELEHGLHRAQTAEQAQSDGTISTQFSRRFQLKTSAGRWRKIAARVDADARRAGKVIPFADLLIGATALHNGYVVGTRNLRHFQMIPNLAVLSI
jgi:predicted nucleic acid-binding protein